MVPRLYSFVSGLADHFAQRNGARLSVSEVALEIRFSDITAEVHLAGQRGGCITDLNFALPGDAIREAQPHFAIPKVGSNDLVAGKMAGDLAIAIGTMALACELIDEHNVAVVVICMVVDRYKGLHGSTPNDFHEHLYHLNNMLMYFCQTEHNVCYHATRGFWWNLIMTWSWDGIHPNKPQGCKMYKKAIWKAIFLAVKHLTISSVILHHQDLAAMANNQ